jgi:A/G-specific adenine glycosylase
MTHLAIHEFKKQIWNYYAAHGRHFDWRGIDDPYKVFVSEIMLQQTQTTRVAQKYPQFLQAFASFDQLANASLKDVLLQWQGMGYNRRGMYLQKAAHIIVANFNGKLPDDPQLLVELPGIGPATAASMCAFAYNKPTLLKPIFVLFIFIVFLTVKIKFMIKRLCH